MEWRGFRLRYLAHQPVEFRSGGLIEPDVPRHAKGLYGVQNSQRAESIHVGGVFRGLKRNGNVTLRRKIVDFVRLHSLNYSCQTVGVRHIPIVQTESNIGIMRVLVEV